MLEFNDTLIIPATLDSRYIIYQGGTGSGKTYSELQFLLSQALLEQGLIISVVSESLPHLKRGAIRDFKNILNKEEIAGVKENKTSSTFTIGKSVIEFFPADSAGKLRGARRDVLFINECNNVSYEAFQQLDVRTRRRTILDFNPVKRFWVHDNLMPELHPGDYLFVKSTYADNQFLSEAEKRNIERRRKNANWWRVYGDGEISEAEGLIFQNWNIVPSQKTTFRADLTTRELTTHLPGSLIGYGVDFGYSHSPTAIVQVNEFNGELYLHEWFYKTGVQNEELLDFATRNIDIRRLAIADSASPQNIDYLMRNGWFGLRPARKGEGSVEFGINLMQERKINVTTESLNLIKELLN